MWLTGLNEEQREAVVHNRGPLLILAGAGSGKTTVLVARTGYLLTEHNIDPEHIAVLTFTNKSARELKARVGQKVGKRANKVWTGTFHSFGLQLLKKYYKYCGLPKQFGVIDSGDAKAIVRELLRDIVHDEKARFDPEKVLKGISYKREREKAELPPHFGDDYKEIVEVLWEKYIRKLKALGVVDFEGLLLEPLQLLQQNNSILEKVQDSIRYLMVDEFQDTNEIQMRLLKLLVQHHQNIAVVGDDDQAIYGWRGACVSHILDFPKVFQPCRVVRLERNYRSTSSILKIANAVIEKNTKRHGKILRAEGAQTQVTHPELLSYENEDEECEQVILELRRLESQGLSYGDMAILYRSNGQGNLLEGYLRKHQIPYKMTGGTALFDRKEAKDVLAFLRTAVAPTEVSARRVINVPSRGIGEASIRLLHDYSVENKVSFWSACSQWQQAGVKTGVGRAIEEWQKLVVSFRELLLKEPSYEVGSRVLDFFRNIGYYNYIRSYTKEEAAAHFRWTSVEVMTRILDRFVQQGGASLKTVREFLDAMELRDVMDDLDENQNAAVQLMTFHASKGLEFPAVVMIGLEEDLIPHKRLGMDIDEERRLFYVGLTRAKRLLLLTHARSRKKYGKNAPTAPSRFLKEIPENYLTIHNGPRPVGEEQRKDMLADLMSKINGQIDRQRLR